MVDVQQWGANERQPSSEDRGCLEMDTVASILCNPNFPAPQWLTGPWFING
jgi:hypothetical protein